MDIDLRIYKFVLKIQDVQDVAMPSVQKMLDVQFQGLDLCVWALIIANAPKRKVRFEIFGTGNPIPLTRSGNTLDDERRYIGTAQEPLRKLVWHVFHGTTANEVEL